MRTAGETAALERRVPADVAGGPAGVASHLLAGNDVCGAGGGGGVVQRRTDDDDDVEQTTTTTTRKGANMTQRVPVPSSEHVAEIVGRQGMGFLVTAAAYLAGGAA